MTLPFAHKSGLPGAIDRTPSKPDYSYVLFRGRQLIQSAELNELQTIERNRNSRLFGRIMKDGDRLDGAAIVMGQTPGVYTLTSGQVYVGGDSRQLTTKTLTGVSAVGETIIGVRISSSYVTEVEDPDLLGLEPGSLAEGEKGAAREIQTAAWGHSNDGMPGELYPVYTVKDGIPLDQTPPQNLTGIEAQIGRYDYGAHGSYVVRGCDVTALGLIGGKQVFSIGKGEANIIGFKRIREYDMRHEEPEAADVLEIEAEPRQYVGNAGTCVLPTYYSPIATVASVAVEKEVTVTVTRGAVSGGMDALQHNSITGLIEVKQGATTYVAGTSYNLTTDKINWSPAGPEPLPGSSYTVKYRFLDVVSAGAGGYTNSASAITVYGGFNGGQIIFRYFYKLPRVDLLCLNKDGASVYVKGQSDAANPTEPIAPTELLALAVIKNDWVNTPKIVGVPNTSITFEKLWKKLIWFEGQADLLALVRLKQEIDHREPVAKRGSFVDPFENDYYRDQGFGQSGALVNGNMVLAIDATPTGFANPRVLLDYTEEVLVQQVKYSICKLINPFQSFSALPAEMYINPASDFWTVYNTVWTSPITRQIANGQRGSVVDERVSETVTDIPFLRSIAVQFQIKGFAANEILSTLTFDSINCKPPGTQTANAQGQINNTLTIPANISAGTKLVRATGSAGSIAETYFTGQGKNDTETLRQIHLVPAPPPPTSGSGDPLAQTFMLERGRFVTAVNIKFCAVGNVDKAVRVDIRTVENGVPTPKILAQSIVDMHTVTLGSWSRFEFPMPFWVSADVEYAIVVKTDDAAHSIYAAKLGDADIATGQRIAGQPYTVGTMHESSNDRSWTSLQDQDMTFQLMGAKFAPSTKSYDFGAMTWTDVSDFVVRCGVDLPTEVASVHFEIERPNAEIIRVAPWQAVQLKEYRSETVKVRAILAGSNEVSPVLFPNVMVVTGKIQTSATYVTRAWNMTGSSKVNGWIKSLLPAGSSLVLDVDNTSGTWNPLTIGQVDSLNDGWSEQQFSKTPWTAGQGRIRITLTGGPAARPALSDLRAWATV